MSQNHIRSRRIAGHTFEVTLEKNVKNMSNLTLHPYGLKAKAYGLKATHNTLIILLTSHYRIL